jgi:pilus assembly protein CpaB
MAAVLPKGMRALSLEISPESGAGGFILPGDRVDVILSRQDKAAAKVSGFDVPVSETILRNLRVLAVDQTVEEKSGQKIVVGKTATLEMTPRQTEVLALGRLKGTLSLALRSIVDGAGKTENVEVESGDDGAGTINIIRFGIVR